VLFILSPFKALCSVSYMGHLVSCKINPPMRPELFRITGGSNNYGRRANITFWSFSRSWGKIQLTIRCNV
jgi:hypothetical protein